MTHSEYVRIKLTAEYDPDEVAIWHIRGEDPNYNLGGYRRLTSLAYVKGKYKHVLEYAMNLPGFIIWGAGGSIEPIDVITMSPDIVGDLNAEKAMLRTAVSDRIRRLDDELHNAKEELKRLGGV